MVICKFYRQGNCRYGQYCQFEHVNHFGNTKVDFCNEDDIIVTLAKEVVLAERGGQWLLSCFAPFKDHPSIPGMEDLSPEEVRWQMYQAQKNGMVEQAKLHFQQLCQDMKAKRDVLKNPNRETIVLLKEFLEGGQKAPQLGLTNNASTNNIFGKQTFGVQNNNPFGGGFSSSNNTSVFGRPNNAAPLFGATPTFGNNRGFGSAASSNPIFNPATNSSTFNTPSVFGSTQSTNPIFGTPSQTVFGQSTFGGTSQLNPQSTTSAFDSSTVSSNSLFNSPITSQTNTSLFGSQTTTSNLFGSSSNTQPNSVFGATTSSNLFNPGIFNQQKTLPAFGGAPVFGGVTNYGSSSIFGASASTFGANTSNVFGAATTTTPAFGGSVTTTTPAFVSSAGITTPVFGTSAVNTMPIFGASAATTTPTFGSSTVINTTPVFGAAVVTTTPAFGAPAVTTTPAFGLGQQIATTFGGTVSAPSVFNTQDSGANTVSIGNSTPFGGIAVTINNPFVTANSRFPSSTPFANTGVNLASTSDTFGTAATSSSSLFANAATTFTSSNVTVSSPFPTLTFGNLNASPFGVINTTASTTTSTTVTTTTITNPFAPRTQQNTSTPFGNIAQNQSIGSISASSPFGQSPFTASVTSAVIDDIVYTPEGLLTDDEKNMFLSEKFIMGKIPLKPPTKDMR